MLRGEVTLPAMPPGYPPTMLGSPPPAVYTPPPASLLNSWCRTDRGCDERVSPFYTFITVVVLASVLQEGNGTLSS